MLWRIGLKAGAVCVLLCLCSSVLAWTAQGHRSIAHEAFEQLNVEQKRFWIELLNRGFTSLTPTTNNPGKRPSVQELLKNAAVWPDRVRDQTLQQIFQQYGSAQVPKPLKPWANRTSATWHYVNAQYFSDKRQLLPARADGNKGHFCPPTVSGDLIAVWPLLLQSFEAVADSRDRVILMAFIVHLLTDAYQPLHVLSSLNAQCQYDRGGNQYCVDPKQGFHSNKKCQVNLHRLWDEGFEVFESPWYKTYPFRAQPEELSSAVALSSDIAKTVYPIHASDVGTNPYKIKATHLVKERASRAVGHLYRLLVALENKVER